MSPVNFSVTAASLANLQPSAPEQAELVQGAASAGAPASAPEVKAAGQGPLAHGPGVPHTHVHTQMLRAKLRKLAKADGNERELNGSDVHPEGTSGEQLSLHPGTGKGGRTAGTPDSSVPSGRSSKTQSRQNEENASSGSSQSTSPQGGSALWRRPVEKPLFRPPHASVQAQHLQRDNERRRPPLGGVVALGASAGASAPKQPPKQAIFRFPHPSPQARKLEEANAFRRLAGARPPALPANIVAAAG